MAARHRVQGLWPSLPGARRCSRSKGSGKMIVEFCSDAISVNVDR
jgi:hypothetical protein